MDARVRAERSLARWLFALLLVSYSFFFYMGGNWNINSRLFLVHAVVDRGTLNIDAYQAGPQGTGDKAFFKGHYYTDKAVGASFLAVPVYAVVRPLLGGLGGLFTDDPQSISRLQWFAGNYLANLFVTALPSALLGVLMFLLLGRFGFPPADRVWVTLAYGLGTIAFPYSTMLFGHQTAAAFLFAAFFLLVRERDREWRPWPFLFAGLLAGCAAITDYLTVFIGAALVGYAFWVGRQKSSLGAALIRLWPYALGFVLPLPLQLGYNWAAFGHPLASAYRYEVVAEFREGMAAGVMGLTHPRLEALYQLTIGSWRGLFYGSPFLVFGLAGLYFLWREKRTRPEAILSSVVFVGLLLINSSYYLWWGGGIYGPRFLLPAIPFLAWAIGGALRAGPKTRIAFQALAVVSAVFVLIVVVTTPLIPEGEKNPLVRGAIHALVTRGGSPTPNFNFNLMMFIVDDLRGVVPYLAFVALALVMAARRVREIRAADGLTPEEGAN